jgi:hypothetical protein
MISIQACDQKSRAFRSAKSASAPASRPTRRTGKVEAVCTSPTRIVDEVKVVINQAAPTDCIKVPIFETIFAAQIARKAGKASGANSEAVASREG